MLTLGCMDLRLLPSEVWGTGRVWPGCSGPFASVPELGTAVGRTWGRGLRNPSCGSFCGCRQALTPCPILAQARVPSCWRRSPIWVGPWHTLCVSCSTWHLQAQPAPSCCHCAAAARPSRCFAHSTSSSTTPDFEKCIYFFVWEERSPLASNSLHWNNGDGSGRPGSWRWDRLLQACERALVGWHSGRASPEQFKAWLGDLRVHLGFCLFVLRVCVCAQCALAPLSLGEKGVFNEDFLFAPSRAPRL